MREKDMASHLHPVVVVVVLVLLLLPSAAVALDITAILAVHPDLSDFTRLLSSTGVAADLASRSSLTLLAVPNPFLARSAAALSRSGDATDALRYHVLLEYLSWPDLRRIPASGRLVTTLFQTTGRAADDSGALNLTRSPSAVSALVPGGSAAANATFISLIAALPYNISVFTVDALLSPNAFDISASEARPPLPALNITRVLLDGRDFNVAASMLEASGVAEEFEADESGAGITVFVPTDEAFAGLPATDRLQSLPAERKAVVLRFHVLHSYYPLGSLESIVNPVQPTVATELTGAGRFTLNISRVNGSMAIDTGVVQASITRTVYDQNPVAVFAVSRVLLPMEIFGREAAVSAGGVAAAPPPEEVGEVSPTAAPMMSPAGSRDGSGAARKLRGGEIWICFSLYLLLLLV